MKRYRVTTGTYTLGGEGFKITDAWLKPSNAHRLLKGSWTSATDFYEIPEYIEDTVNPVNFENDTMSGGASSLGPLRAQAAREQLDHRRFRSLQEDLSPTRARTSFTTSLTHS